MEITIVAFESCMTSAVFGLTDAFALAAALSARSNQSSWAAHRVRLASATGAAVTGFGGFRIEPHGPLTQVAAGGVILVPPIIGEVAPVLERERATVDWLAGAAPQAALLASACTGAFLLGEAGVLAGRRVTTNPLFAAQFAARYPGVTLALDERLAGDGRVVCAGATTAFLDLAVHVIDRLGGHDLAVATAKLLSLDKNPGSQRPYLLFIAPRDHGDAQVLAVQDRIEADFAAPLAMAELAGDAGMSLRSLSRRFLAATGLTPMQYLRLVRVETAKRLLETGPRSVEQVAADVGYGDTRAFVRAFGEAAGLTPADYRRRFRAR